MDYDQLLQQLVNGLLIGCVYSLIAIGLTLIWGVMNIVNFAHGDFLMLGMFTAFWGYSLFHIDPLFSIPFCGLFLFGLGYAIYRFAVSKVMHGPMLAQLVVTFGISMLISNTAVLLWSPNFRSIDKPLLSGTWAVGPVQIGVVKFVASLGAVVVSLALMLFLNRSKAGKAILATEMNRDSALLMGINVERVNAISFGIGAALVGIAGGFLAMYYYIYPQVGGLFGLISFAIVALGGYFFDPAYKYAIVFLLYLLVVWFKPQGLRGW
jgi:branched-chain amino acid transport system permease protein